MRMLPGSEASLAGMDDTEKISIMYAAAKTGSFRPLMDIAGRNDLGIKY